MQAKQTCEINQSAALLRRHGCTGATGGLSGPVFTGFDNAGKPIVDFTEADKSLLAMREHFGDAVANTYGGLALVGITSYQPSDYSSTFGRSFEQVTPLWT